MLFGGCEQKDQCSNEVFQFLDQKNVDPFFAQGDDVLFSRLSIQDNMCDEYCNDKGACDHKVCYCKPGWTGKTCKLSDAWYAHGIVAMKAYLFFGGCFLAGLIFGILVFNNIGTTVICCYCRIKSNNS